MRRTVDSGELPRPRSPMSVVGKPALTPPAVISENLKIEQLKVQQRERLEFPPGAIPEGYYPMNPSICLHEGKLFAVVRCVSYRLPHGQYQGKSRNLFCRLADDLVVESVHEMEDKDPAPRCSAPSYGYEDIRLFSWGDGKGMGGSATVLDRAPGKVQIALLTLSPEGDILRAEVQETGSGRMEKNWMPVVRPEGLRWIDRAESTVVRAPGRWDPVAIYSAPARVDPEELRGSSPLLESRDGYLAVTHEIVEPRGQFARLYLHRFVKFTKELRVVGTSRRFFFVRPGVEFCAGIARHPLQRERLFLSFGVNDEEAWIAHVFEDEVHRMMT